MLWKRSCLPTTKTCTGHLLTYLGVSTMILTGVAGNICILFSANDAYLRDFNVIVPGDCVASNTPGENQHALEQLRTVLKADVAASTELDLRGILRQARPGIPNLREV